jgi:thiol:disulfide interchange protein
MPLTKRRRNQLWYGYVIGMVLLYGLTFGLVTLIMGSAALGFLAGFGSLFVSMIGFLILMRVLGTSARPGGR